MGGNASKPASNQAPNEPNAQQVRGVTYANGTKPGNGRTGQNGLPPGSGYAAAAAEANAAKKAARASPNNQRSWRLQRPEAARVAGERLASNVGTGVNPYTSRGGSRKIRKANKKSRKQRR